MYKCTGGDGPLVDSVQVYRRRWTCSVQCTSVQEGMDLYYTVYKCTGGYGPVLCGVQVYRRHLFFNITEKVQLILPD